MSKQKERLTIRLDPEMLAELEKAALAARCDKSSILRSALASYFQEQGTNRAVDAVGDEAKRFREIADLLARVDHMMLRCDRVLPVPPNIPRVFDAVVYGSAAMEMQALGASLNTLAERLAAVGLEFKSDRERTQSSNVRTSHDRRRK